MRSDGKAYNMRFGEDCLWGGARIRLTQFPANIPIRVHIDYAFMGFILDIYIYTYICVCMRVCGPQQVPIAILSICYTRSAQPVRVVCELSANMADVRKF